ncbi:MAG: cadmium-translocating P-type ATPase [Ruminococcus sp.]|nr:cadmium-translocating P-type ATPase [Ruminococcus sp.]
MKEGASMKRTYIIKNLDCAHCGALIEEAIGKIDGVESSVLSFPSRKIVVEGELRDDILAELNRVCDEIEPGTVIAEEGEFSGDSETNRSDIVLMATGVLLFIAGIILHSVLKLNIMGIILYILAYLLLGKDILINTAKNISKGKIFDENLLMTVATVGAFVLGEYSEAVGVVLFFKIGELFESYAVNRSRKSITALTQLKVEEAEVFVDGEYRKINADDIAVGDRVRVRAGERVAVDGVIVEGSTLIDMSAINGESVPVEATVGDTIVSGSINMNSVIVISAQAEAKDSMMAKIAEAIESATLSKPKTERFISRFASVYTPIVLAVALFTAVVPSVITGEWSKWLYTALTFLVISCPCALVLSVPLAYYAGIGRASELGILFKGGASLEALGKVKVIAFDKTGTITDGSFGVTEVTVYNGADEQKMLSFCMTCEEASSHPVAVSITEYCRNRGVCSSDAEEFCELAGRGVSAVVGGEKILCGNIKLMEENAIAVGEASQDSHGTAVYVAVSGVLMGRIIVSDKIREGASEAVKALKKSGIKTALLSGDRKENTVSVAEKLGMDIAEGALLPAEKLEKIRKLREEYGPVMFVGDGINDGPVLAGADVGGAVSSGSDLALEASDVVLFNSAPRSAFRAKEIADKTQSISRQNIVFALAVKAMVLVLGLLGISSMWFAVFADSGVAMLLILNSVRLIKPFGKGRKAV